MRVLAVCHESPDMILGGMGRHVRELYRHMAMLDDAEVDLLTSGSGEGSRSYCGFRYHNSDKHVPWKPRGSGMSTLLVADMQLGKTLMRLLAEGRRWDVVHFHEWVSLQVAWQAAAALSVPKVATMHLCMAEVTAGAGSQDGKDHAQDATEMGVYMLNQEARMHESEEVILCSNAYSDLCKRRYHPHRNYNVIPNGIDTNSWRPGVGDAARARVRNHLRSSRPIALFVGRIAEMKGVETILDLVEKEDTGYQIILAGEVNAHSEKEQEQWCVTRRIRKLEKEHPERLRWVGFQNDEGLRDLYELAAVGLMPSLHEPFGIVALEFMAMGTPLISTEVDGLRDIVLDESGNEYAMIVHRDSVEDLREALTMCRKDSVLAELRELGLTRVAFFDWNRVAESTVRVYRAAVERSQLCLT